MSFNSTLKTALVAHALLLGSIGLAQAQASIPVMDLHTGPNNAITDVPGILVGHSTRKDAQTGTTALIFPEGALMSMSPSGGAPGTRLGALLTAQHQDSQRVVMHGLTLSGGSIYGLDTACGVVKFLDEKGWTYGGRAHVPGGDHFRSRSRRRRCPSRTRRQAV